MPFIHYIINLMKSGLLINNYLIGKKKEKKNA